MTTNQMCRAAGLAGIAYLLWSTVIGHIDVNYVWWLTTALQIFLVAILIWVFYCTRPQPRHQTRHPSTVQSRIHGVRERRAMTKEFPEGP